MPRLNLRDQDQDLHPENPGKPGSDSNPPRLDDFDDGNGRKAPWIVLASVVILIGVVIVALNQFHVIQLWGKKPARVVESIEPLPSPTETTATAQQPPAESNPAMTEPTPLPTKPSGVAASSKGAAKSRAPKQNPPAETDGGASAGSPSFSGAPSAGSYAVQISSWPTKGPADRIASRLSTAGFNAYVEEGDVSGKTWYRVRVGKFATRAEANTAIANLTEKGYEGAVVVK